MDYIQSMKYSTQVKPISYIKAHSAEVLAELETSRGPIVVTQNGEAKAVIQDLRTYEETQETLTLLKILALGEKQIAAGKTRPLRDVIAELKAQER